jgi:hypothetical protein
VFSCTPAEALQQDYTLVQSVMDWRAARRAVDLFDASDGLEQLHKSPGLLTILAMMQRAQDGRDLYGGDLEGEGKLVIPEKDA